MLVRRAYLVAAAALLALAVGSMALANTAALINADDWHNQGIDGRFVKIAIIDEGFANWTEAQNKSEVPTKMEIVASRDYHGGQTGDVYSGTSKHGTLVTAAVYDIAPEASYYLVKVHNGDDLITPEEEFNQAIRDLLDVWGIDIVVMSVSFRQEDFFYGTGRLSRALFAPSTSQGRAWFIAAGNQAYLHLRQDPLNGTMSTRLTKSPDDVSFKPYVTWNSWNFTNCHQNNNPPPSYGVVINDENGLPLRTRNDPRECIDITDPEHEFSPIPWLDNDFVDIIVSKHGNGAQGVEVKLFTTGTTGTLGNFSNEESIGPLAADANVLSITGANRTFYNSPLIPSGTPEVHPYSYGPTTDDRAKPDVAAPGGVLVDLGPGPAFFDGSSYSNGAAAGVGALLKHIKPDLTVLDLFTQLKSTDPVNGSLVDVAPVGWDAIYGHGRISLKAVPYPTNDTDSDGRIDIHDNCPLKANAPLFADSDQDGQGDVCDNTCGASAPITVSSASDTTPGGGVVVNGSGFGGWDQIELIGSSTVAVQNVVLQSTSQLPGLVPAGTATGTYAVRVFRSAGCESQETTELNVTQESCGIGFELVAIVGFFVCERRMRKRGAHAKGMSR